MLTPLLAKISEYFPEHGKTCLKNVLTLSLCMIIKETVNLNKLKGTVGAVLSRSSTQADSNYKRLIRIFDRYSDSTLCRTADAAGSADVCLYFLGSSG